MLTNRCPVRSFGDERDNIRVDVDRIAGLNIISGERSVMKETKLMSARSFDSRRVYDLKCG